MAGIPPAPTAACFRDFAEHVALGTITGKLLTKEREQRFKKRFEAQVTQGNSKPVSVPAARIAPSEEQIERYLDAIGQGGFSPSLKKRLEEAERPNCWRTLPLAHGRTSSNS
jgi:hypothetical protein